MVEYSSSIVPCMSPSAIVRSRMQHRASVHDGTRNRTHPPESGRIHTVMRTLRRGQGCPFCLGEYPQIAEKGAAEDIVCRFFRRPMFRFLERIVLLADLSASVEVKSHRSFPPNSRAVLLQPVPLAQMMTGGTEHGITASIEHLARATA
jgi:hypothetical protein